MSELGEVSCQWPVATIKFINQIHIFLYKTTKMKNDRTPRRTCLSLSKLLSDYWPCFPGSACYSISFNNRRASVAPRLQFAFHYDQSQRQLLFLFFFLSSVYFGRLHLPSRSVGKYYSSHRETLSFPRLSMLYTCKGEKGTRSSVRARRKLSGGSVFAI